MSKSITVTLHPEAGTTPPETVDLTPPQYTAFAAVIAARLVDAPDGTRRMARLSTVTATNYPWNVTISAHVAKSLEELGLIEFVARKDGRGAIVASRARLVLKHTPEPRDDVESIVARLGDEQRKSNEENARRGAAARTKP